MTNRFQVPALAGPSVVAVISVGETTTTLEAGIAVGPAPLPCPIFEEPSFYPYLSGRVNLEVLAELDGAGARTRIDDVLEQVQLTGRAARIEWAATHAGCDPSGYEGRIRAGE